MSDTTPPWMQEPIVGCRKYGGLAGPCIATECEYPACYEKSWRTRYGPAAADPAPVACGWNASACRARYENGYRAGRESVAAEIAALCAKLMEAK